MVYLTAAALLLIIASFMVIKNARGSADRGESPDISNPTSAPDNIGDHDSDSADGDGDVGE
ncbi:MAG: hypothetical protein WB217_06200 [Mesobacillus sp.]|uniref:hypothetical protein n=1 Tax=Mesobacillus sp. TaxID=2675271 RepID=UPI003C3DCAE5